MGRNHNRQSKFERLRQKAEEILNKTSGPNIEITDFESLLHELQVYQVELETQNRELTEAQQELTGLKNRYQDIFEYAPVGYCILDENLIIKEINTTGAKLLDAKKRHLINSPFNRYFTVSCRSILHDHFKTLFSDKTNRSCDLQLRNSDTDGNEPFIRLDSILTSNLNGQKLYVLAAFSDITTQKKAEDVVKRDKERLESIVKEKTEKLLSAEKEAQRSKRLADLGRLSATIAHELRRPLAAIKLSLYNIRKKRKNPAIDVNLFKRNYCLA